MRDCGNRRCASFAGFEFDLIFCKNLQILTSNFWTSISHKIVIIIIQDFGYMSRSQCSRYWQRQPTPIWKIFDRCPWRTGPNKCLGGRINYVCLRWRWGRGECKQSVFPTVLLLADALDDIQRDIHHISEPIERKYLRFNRHPSYITSRIRLFTRYVTLFASSLAPLMPITCCNLFAFCIARFASLVACLHASWSSLWMLCNWRRPQRPWRQWMLRMPTPIATLLHKR